MTSVAAAKRVRPSWFDAHRKLVSEQDAGVHKERTRSSQPEFLTSVTSSTNERRKPSDVVGERIYARSKSAVRRIPYFEAGRDRNFCVVTLGNEQKGCRFRNSFKTIKNYASNEGRPRRRQLFEWECLQELDVKRVLRNVFPV